MYGRGPGLFYERNYSLSWAVSYCTRSRVHGFLFGFRVCIVLVSIQYSQVLLAHMHTLPTVRHYSYRTVVYFLFSTFQLFQIL